MRFVFEAEKTIQVAAELLRREPHRQMSRIRLLKLMYIADREALAEIGRPITGDRAVAMKHGPVLSRSYDIIKGEDVKSPEFDRYFAQDGHQIFLVNDPGNGNLNRYQMRKLHEVSKRFRDFSDWDIAEHTHEFPEWQKNDPGDSSKPISLEDILEALDFSPERIESVKRDAQNVHQLRGLFRREA